MNCTGPVDSPGKAMNRAGGNGYNLHMLVGIAQVAMWVLEAMFFVGLAGSTVVVLISFVEDGKELFGKDEPPESRA